MTYDAYGNGRHWYVGDVDGSGSVVPPDFTMWAAADGKSVGQAGYTAEMDLDRDGVVTYPGDSLFATAYIEPVQWRLEAGEISVAELDNRVGYAGYRFDPELRMYQVRHRYYDTALGRWITRDPAGYVDGGNLYGYVKENPFGSSDPMGLFTPITSKLKQYVLDINADLRAGNESAAADDARDLYKFIGNAGRFSPTFSMAAGYIRHWLGGTGSSRRVSPNRMVELLGITKVMGGRYPKSTKDQFIDYLCSFPNINKDTKTRLISIPINPSQAISRWGGPDVGMPYHFGMYLRATTPKYHYSLGGFWIGFEGEYSCRKSGKCHFNGIWTLYDRYNWKPGQTATIFGQAIADDWALLVEKHHGAKPFDINGSMFYRYTFDCPCPPEEDSNVPSTR